MLLGAGIAAMLEPRRRDVHPAGSPGTCACST
jgi:hypothetical protein